jgi:hypothetical protein
MKTRISAIVCLLCVVGYSDLSRAEDPSSQRVADPYAISSVPPTMSSGTIEPYLSFMAGIAIPRSEDAFFKDGTQPTVVRNIDYRDETLGRGQRGDLVSHPKQVGGIRSRPGNHRLYLVSGRDLLSGLF